MLKKKVLSCAVVLGMFTTQIAPLVIHAQESVVDEVTQVEVPVESEPEVSESVSEPVSESVSETTPEPAPEPEPTPEPEQPVVEESSEESSSEESSSEEELEIEEDEDTVAFEDIEWVTVELVTETNPETGEVLATIEVQVPDLNKYFAISKGKRLPVKLTEDQRAAIYENLDELSDINTGFYYLNEYEVVLMLPEYEHTLFTKEEFDEYKNTQLSNGFNYDPATDLFNRIPVADVSMPGDTWSDPIQLGDYPITQLGYYQESQVEQLTDEDLAAILGYRNIIRIDLATGENTTGTLHNGKGYSVTDVSDGALLEVDGGQYSIGYDAKGRGQMDIDDSSSTDFSRTLLVVTTGEGYEKSELEFGTQFYVEHKLYGTQRDAYGTFSALIIPDESVPEEPEESTPEESTPGESTPEESTPEESTPEESTPGESTPEESTPEESQPELVTKTETKVEKVPFDTVTVRDATLLQGQTQVSVEGRDGEKTITYENYYVDGELVDSIKIKEEITTPVVNKVVREGTGVAQAPGQGGPDGTGVQYGEGTPLDAEGNPVITYADRGPKNHLYSEELHKDLTCDELFELGMYNFQNTDLGYTTERDTLNNGIGCPYGVESADDVLLENTGIDNPIIAIIGVIAGIGLGGFFLLKGKRGAKEGGNVGE